MMEIGIEDRTVYLHMNDIYETEIIREKHGNGGVVCYLPLKYITSIDKRAIDDYIIVELVERCINCGQLITNSKCSRAFYEEKNREKLRPYLNEMKKENDSVIEINKEDYSILREILLLIKTKGEL